MNPPRRLRGAFGMYNLREGFVNLREGFVEAPWRLREGFAKAPRAPPFGNDSSDNGKPPYLPLLPRIFNAVNTCKCRGWVNTRVSCIVTFTYCTTHGTTYTTQQAIAKYVLSEYGGRTVCCLYSAVVYTRADVYCLYSRFRIQPLYHAELATTTTTDLQLHR